MEHYCNCRSTVRFQNVMGTLALNDIKHRQSHATITHYNQKWYIIRRTLLGTHYRKVDMRFHSIVCLLTMELTLTGRGTLQCCQCLQNTGSTVTFFC